MRALVVCSASLNLSASIARSDEDLASELLKTEPVSIEDIAPRRSSSSSVEAGIGLYSYNYLYAPNSGKNSSFFSATGFLREEQSGKFLESRANFEGVAIVSPSTAWTIEAPEAYVGTSSALSKTFALRAGRELKNWSQLDEDFEMGIVQPRFRWDYVHPQAVGLTGLYFEAKAELFQFTVFGSPISVPERGIPVEVRDNRIFAIDPYFNPPASSMPFRGVPTDVSYDLVRPSTGEILAHPAGCAMARVGAERGFWGSSSYCHKPMNQLLFSYTGDYNMSVDQQRIEATLYPRIAYHEVISTQVGFESRYVSAGLSELEDRPTDDRTTLGENMQVVTPSHALSPAIEAHWGDLKYAPTRVRLAGLKQWGGNSPDQGPLSTGTTSVFENRYFSHTAAVLSAESPLSFAGNQLRGNYRLLWDFEHLGTIQSMDVYFGLRKSVLVNLGGDLLNSREDPSATDPISQYRANDRLRLGVSYVF